VVLSAGQLVVRWERGRGFHFPTPFKSDSERSNSHNLSHQRSLSPQMNVAASLLVAVQRKAIKECPVQFFTERGDFITQQGDFLNKMKNYPANGSSPPPLVKVTDETADRVSCRSATALTVVVAVSVNAPVYRVELRSGSVPSVV